MKSDRTRVATRMVCALSACLSLSSAIACHQQATQPTPPPPGPLRSATLRVTGTVVENGSGPVAEASVEASTCPPGNRSTAQTATDAMGRFGFAIEVGTSTLGCVSLRVEKTGYATEWQQVQGTLEDIRIDLQRARRVSGTIMEVDGGPVPGVRISSAGSSPVSTAFSDARGSFVITGVTKIMNLAKDAFVPALVEVPNGQDVDLGTVRLQRQIFVKRGSRVWSRLSREDVVHDTYPMWDERIWCAPCKQFDLEGGAEELVTVLRWSGAIPLQLWATDGLTDVLVRPTPGTSELTLSLPPIARYLLVGLPSSTFAPDPLPQSIDFELSITGP